jgi:hypothetical protein
MTQQLLEMLRVPVRLAGGISGEFKIRFEVFQSTDRFTGLVRMPQGRLGGGLDDQGVRIVRIGANADFSRLDRVLKLAAAVSEECGIFARPTCPKILRTTIS